jgi:hypothetical protein
MMMVFYPWSNILLPRKTRLESWIKTAGWHEETQVPGKNGISTNKVCCDRKNSLNYFHFIYMPEIANFWLCI